MHTHVSSPRLASLLADPSSTDAGTPAGDFAEGLGQWLGALDAVRLREALQSIGMPAAARPSAGAPSPATGRPPAGARQPAGGQPSSSERERAAASLAQACQRVRAGLAEAIGAAPPLDPVAEYAPYRRQHLEQQRRMESRVGALRTQVRGALTQASPRLAKLAALDAAMAAAIGEREQRLLAGLPALLERRFERLLDEHRRALQASGQPDDPATWRQPGGWLDAFERQWRQTLLAELDVRLQPVAGMIEAFSSEVAQCQ